MKIYKDLISGDELLSDSFPMVLLEDAVYEVQSKMTKKVESGNYDIGANASEEGAGDDEGFESSEQTIDALVDASRLQLTQFDKKGYMAYIKTYMATLLTKLKDTNPDRVSAFQKGASAFVKKVLGDFNNYDFYTGESMTIEAMVVLKSYKEDGITPYFYFFKDGLLEEKV